MTDRRARPGTASLAAFSLLLVPAAAAAGVGLQVTGSVYVDGWIAPGAGDAVRSGKGVSPDASVKLGVDIDDELSFSAKACISCHGIDVEHAVIDYQPSIRFNVQFGRLAVPFGEYANRVDGSGHRTVSGPLIYDMGRTAWADRSNFNGPVIMLPYVDTGVLVYGQAFLGRRIQVWYGAYAVAGLKGAADADWIALRTSPYGDDNETPALGGRVAFTLVGEPDDPIGDASLGASWTGGRFDRGGRLRYDAVAVDAAVPFRWATLRGEWAMRRTEVDPALPGWGWQVVDPWVDKSGFYAELEHPLGGRLQAVYRYDQLSRKGAPLPGSAEGMTPDALLRRWTAGLVVTPVRSLYLKLSYEYWIPSGRPELHSGHVGVGGAF